VLDTTRFPDAFATIDAFLSLAFFEEAAFTVDYEHGHVVVTYDVPRARMIFASRV
jgi:hypothetical protein